MDVMEMDIHQLKSHIYPQPSASVSFFQGGILPREDGNDSGLGINNRGTTPMETKEGKLPLLRALDV
jgi:hypothetical protein